MNAAVNRRIGSSQRDSINLEFLNHDQKTRIIKFKEKYIWPKLDREKKQSGGQRGRRRAR